MINWYGIKEWLLMKAINFAKNRQGLVQVLRTITVKGTTFTRAYWIRPDDVKDNDKVIGGFQNLPHGHSQKPKKISPTAKLPQEIRDITKAFQENYLKNHPTREAANEAFYNALRAVAIQWDEIPSKPHVNMMRAKMAVNIAIMAGWRPPGVDQALLDKAKQYIHQSDATPQPHPIVNPKPAQAVSTGLPPKAKKASEESKAKMKAFYATFDSNQAFLDALDKMGIERLRNKKNDKDIELMRAKEALSKYIENGFDPFTYVPPADTDTDTTQVDTAQVDDTVDDTPKKDMSLLEVPDDATPEQIEIIKHINNMTDVEGIKNCALMGLVPEDDMSKDYIVNTMLPTLKVWITKGKKAVDRFGSVYYHKKAPESVAKKFKEDCDDLGIDFDTNVLDHSKLGADLSMYMDLPKNIKEAVMSSIDQIKMGGRRYNIDNTMFVAPNVIDEGEFNIIHGLSSAFSNYIVENPQGEDYTNLGYNGLNIEKSKAQYDVNKEGFVRYLRKLQSEYPTDKELSDEVEDSIKTYDEMMKLVGGNQRILQYILKNSTWRNAGSANNIVSGMSFNTTMEMLDAGKAAKTLEILNEQADNVINTLVKEGYSDEDIMLALTDTEHNDYNIRYITVVDSKTGASTSVDCATPGSPSEHNNWNAYAQCYALMKFQKMRGIPLGSAESEKYLSKFRLANDVINSPEEILEYCDCLKQLSDVSSDTALKVRELSAKLFGLEVRVPKKSDEGYFGIYTQRLAEKPSDAKRTILSNLILAHKQHQFNEDIVNKMRRFGRFSNRNIDRSTIFNYYSGSFMHNQSNNSKGRVKQSGNKESIDNYTGKELEDQIQYQLNNATTYSKDYVTGMKEYYDKLSKSSAVPADGIAESDGIGADIGGVEYAMSKPSRDIFFNILANITSCIPSMAENPDTKKNLATHLGYIPFDPRAKDHPTGTPQLPVKEEVKKELTPEDVKNFRQKLFEKAACTIAALDEDKSAEMRKDFMDNWDYKPGEKTPEGQTVNYPVHQNKVPIFNSRFFEIRNTVTWKKRFQEEQERMKALKLNPKCYAEMELFHACPRFSTGSIVGRDQGWFMGGEAVDSGEMLGPGGYFAGKAGKSSVYCGDSPYSMYHRGELEPGTADGAFMLCTVMRGENPHVVRKSSKKQVREEVKGSQYTSSAADMGSKPGTNNRPLIDWETAIRNNALILPHHFVDVSCRVLGTNVLLDSNGNYMDWKGNIIADSNGVSVNYK